MKYVVNLPEYVVVKIRELLEKGEYEDFASFLLTAVENQLFLEHEDEEKLTYEPSEETGKESMDILSSKDFTDVETISMPSPGQYLYPNIENEEKLGPLWGQINRIFPMKMGLRILANMLRSTGPYVGLQDFQQKATSVARLYGLNLRKEDKKQGRSRNSFRSTGLPIHKIEAKSKQRYKTHFLAYLRKDGVTEGALGRLKFVNLKREPEDNELIGITREGLDFASLENPVLDNNDTGKGTLSETETEFYIKHIFHNIPGESQAIRQILNHISNGISTPKELNKRLEGDYADYGWSEDVLNTNRSGLISRLHELGLIEKIREGKEVTYAVTSQGLVWLDLFLGS